MKILGFLGKALSKLNPLKPLQKAGGNLVEGMVLNVVKKFGVSLLKGLAVLLIAVLTAVLGFDPQGALAGQDPQTVKFTLLAWAAILLAVRAAISALKRWADYKPELDS